MLLEGIKSRGLEEDDEELAQGRKEQSSRRRDGQGNKDLDEGGWTLASVMAAHGGEKRDGYAIEWPRTWRDAEASFSLSH